MINIKKFTNNLFTINSIHVNKNNLKNNAFSKQNNTEKSTIISHICVPLYVMAT